ncbi:hypothetical protein BD779DRAFT_1536368 [Infundibulicybe gibba]|nr:hypothetical protein BD779DRAFT_1536368 [Infundibulicybe gibba]
MFSTSVLVGSLFFAVHVSGLVARNPLEPLLVARQSTSPLDVSTLPAQCQAQCTTIADILNNCTTDACLCTNPNGASLKTCVQCVVGPSPSTSLTTQGQAILDQFVAGCSGSISPITLDGSSSGSGGGGLASPFPSATIPPFAGASSSPGSAPTRTATTGLGTSPSTSGVATGSAGSDGSASPFNSPSAAGRATVGSVGLIGFAMGAAVLLF